MPLCRLRQVLTCFHSSKGFEGRCPRSDRWGIESLAEEDPVDCLSLVGRCA